jgi:hypothetical protein
MTIDINKKYRYRSGEPARILCVDAPGDQPVISLNGSGDTLKHKATGQFFHSNHESSLDLIEVREPREGFVSVVTKAALERAYGLGDPVGTFVTHRFGDEEDGLEVIRVREIID